MGGSLSARLIGRLAGLLLVGSGLLSIAVLPLPQPAVIDRRSVLFVSLIAVVVGALVLVAPWHRWPRKTSLGLMPLAFALIAIGNYYGSSQPYTFGVFFVVAFAWLGIGHSRGWSIRFAPVATVAYIAPLLFRPDIDIAAASSAALTIPVSVLVGESLAWISGRERRTQQRARALARIATALGAHLDEDRLLQTLVAETKVALLAEHAVLYRLDPKTRTISRVYADAADDDLHRFLRSVEGASYEDMPPILALARGEPVVAEDTRSGRHYPPGVVERFGIRSYLVMPVLVGDELVALLSCGDASGPRRYERGELSLARAVAAQASVAIENAMLYRETLDAARRDMLTGLGNRRAFHERLNEEIERARRHDRALGLVLLDPDSFKLVNDALGHQAGDRVLRRIAEALERTRREGDAAFRVGGDEFALVLPETDLAGTATLAERVRRVIERARLGPEEEQLHLTVSVGVSAFPFTGSSPDELFERADTALYEVKTSGGNAVALPSSKGHLPGVRYGIDVRDVIEGRRIVPHYQPIVDLEARSVLGYETFSRVGPGLGGAPTPTLFRAAGALGLVEELDRVCREVSLLSATGLPPSASLFLNVATAALESPSFRVRDLLEAIAHAGIEPRRVVLEITEQERSTGSEQLAANLAACRQVGLRTALDDLGTGGSDLELLAKIPFDFVKVDMSFVQGAHELTRRRVLRGLGLLVAETGATAIAEGVETAADLALVRELGFAAAQGFLFGEPASHFHHPSPREVLTAS